VTGEPADHRRVGRPLDAEMREWIRARLAADASLMRRLITLLADALMAADADRLCRAGPEGTGERVNRRNGYRAAVVDTSAGVVHLSVPRLRSGGYAPRWLLDEPGSAAATIEDAACVAYTDGVASDAVGDLVIALGMRPLPSAPLDTVAAVLDAAVDEERRRPLRRGPYPELWLLAHTPAPGRRIRTTAARLAVTGEAHGTREVLGLTVTDVDDETAWRLLLHSLVERGLNGVAVAKSDVFAPGLVSAVHSELPDARYEGPVLADSSGGAWTPAAAPDGGAKNRPAPVMIVRDHGRFRLGSWSSEDLDEAAAPEDPAAADRHDHHRWRVAPILAGVVALVVAVALAAAWRNGPEPAPPVRPSTPPTTAVPAPPPSSRPVSAPSTSVVAAPPTNPACNGAAASFADLEAGGPRSPWLQQVLCAAVGGA
jgi:hypothetical protein